MKKKYLYIGLLIVGIISLVLAVLSMINGDYDSTFMGVGIGCTGVAICKLCLLYWYRNCPEEVRVYEINQRDERSQMIRNKAKAKCADIMQWAVMAVVWATIFADIAVWVTLVLIVIFSLFTVLELILINRYEDEM